MFFHALSFRFYCFLMIGFVVANVLSGRDFGAMARAQRRARETGALLASHARPMTSKAFATAIPSPRARVGARTALIPIAGLLIYLLAALWVDGREALGPQSGIGTLFSPRAWRDVLGQAENSIMILAQAAGVGLLLAMILGLWWARMPLRSLGEALRGGLRGSLLPMMILVLAWSLKIACDQLQTGRFLVDASSGLLSPLWFPALVFILAGLTSFATGTSWGTMAILLPTAVPLAFQLDGQAYGLTTMMTLGAVLDGAIWGDHCSPISDTTIMSSISSCCDHLHHVSTQLPYSLTVGGLAIACGYLPAAAGFPPAAGLLGGAVCIGILFLLLGLRPDGPQTEPSNRSPLIRPTH
jgi:Na+/H+ antiporter NhaC